jgi:preprotein translocase subunit SecY
MSGLMGAGKFTELRSRLLFVIGALIVYRIGCYIPVPGVNPEAMLADEFAERHRGGHVLPFALNGAPSGVDVVHLMTQILPSELHAKEGESGCRKSRRVWRGTWPCSVAASPRRLAGAVSRGLFPVGQMTAVVR